MEMYLQLVELKLFLVVYIYIEYISMDTHAPLEIFYE